MASVFYTSDLHIGHQKVAEIRGFSTTQEHDDWLADQWDGVVKRSDDIVYVLGDISAGGSAAQVNALAWFALRRGAKILIPGNHDGSHPMHRDADRWQARYAAVFHPFMPPYRRRKINGQSALLSHFPYEGDRGADRFTQYRLPNEGLPILHGHTHSAEQTSYCTVPTWDGGNGISNTLQIHVGVDAWGGKPVHTDLIGALLDDRARPKTA